MKIIRLDEREWERFCGGLLGLRLAANGPGPHYREALIAFLNDPPVSAAIEKIRDAEECTEREDPPKRGDVAEAIAWLRAQAACAGEARTVVLELADKLEAGHHVGLLDGPRGFATEDQPR